MTGRLRASAQALVNRWDSPAWGGSAENLRHTGEYIAELRAALAQQDAQAVSQGLYTVISFLLGEGPLHGLYFGEHKEGQGSFWWRTHLRDAMLNAAPTPPAQQPLGWLDRKAVECLQGPELNWMPAWNRPTSSDPVPIFLLPPAQRVMLTDEEIRDLWSWSMTAEAERTANTQQHAFAQGVIEAYERKNGLKP